MSQLSFDFEDSSSQRTRRAKAALEGQLSMFTYAPNIDIHLHSPTEALAQLSGADYDRGELYLNRLVGSTRPLASRRVAFPAARLDRLLSLRPPAHVTLDAAASSVARALWAAKLGLRPLRVSRHRQRLIASSVRWPTALAVVDAPWPAIATMIKLDIPLDIEPKARILMADKIAQTGGHIASAWLAGSAVMLETSRPELLEAMRLPALAYAGSPNSGRYRIPLLASEVLLAEDSINVQPDLAAAIKKATSKTRPLSPLEGFPWELYPFQARDAARALRIIETAGGVLLAGEMGSGKAQPVDSPVLTPAGYVPIGSLSPGDTVVTAHGGATKVLGVYPQGELEVFRLTFSDGSTTECSPDHLWETQVEGAGRRVERLSDILASDHTSRIFPLVSPIENCTLSLSSFFPHAVSSPMNIETRRDIAVLLFGSRLDSPGEYTSSRDVPSDISIALARSLGCYAFECQEGVRAVVGAVGKRLVGAVKVPPRECVCIEVEDESGLYVTSDYTVTHNTTIALALVQQLELWPLLVVCPLAAMSTWARQLGEMNRTFYLATETPSKSWETILARKHEAIVISYDRLHSFSEIIEQMSFAAIVADELQRIRTPSSRRSRALRALAQSTPIRIGLSGTPLQNKVDDLLAPTSFLVPGEFKPRTTTKDLSDLYPGDPIESIAQHVGTLMVRRRMEDTGVSLPNKAVRRLYVDLTAEQRHALADLEYEAEAAKSEGALDRMHAFARLQKMRQIVSCPSMAGVAGPSPKVVAATELVEEFVEMGRKCVIFCANRRTWTDLAEHMKKIGVGYTGIWGSTPIGDRLANEKAFHNDENVKVFIGTIQSCAESLTLSPTGTVVIHCDYVYNPSDLAQAEARVYRMNQTNPVDIIYLHASAPGGTLDDRMAEILELKRALFAQVIDRTKHQDDTQVSYSLGDLVYLLTGTRDEKIDAADKARKEEIAREQAKKRHARVTAHAHKGKNKTSDDFFDDGSVALLLEDFQEDEEFSEELVEAVEAEDEDEVAELDDFDVDPLDPDLTPDSI